MKTEKWIEILVGVIIIGGLGWVLSKQYDMKGTLGYLESTTTTTSKRVDRIVEVMPDIKIRIAQEEIKKPFKTAVITTEPIESSSGIWVSLVHVMDTEKNQRSTFEVSLDGQYDKKLKNIITGITFRFDDHALPFFKLIDFEGVGETAGPFDLPWQIDRTTSFLLYKSPEKLIEEFEFFGVVPKVYSLPSKVDTWIELKKEIDVNTDTYITKQPIKKK